MMMIGKPICSVLAFGLLIATAACDDASSGGAPEDRKADMVAIVGGTYINSPGPADALPQEERQVADFYLDREEVTVAKYMVCVDDGACDLPTPSWVSDCSFLQDGSDQKPMTCTRFEQAEEYCDWAGKRLPTEWEFEWVARGGTRGTLYPWGASPEPSCDVVIMSEGGISTQGCEMGGPAPVGSRPTGASPDGVQDLIGNVSEWAVGDTGVVQCGGGYTEWKVAKLRADARVRGEDTVGRQTGFRCAMSM